MTRKAKTRCHVRRARFFAVVHGEGGAMKKVTMTIRGRDGSVLRLAMLLCLIQTNTAMAQQPGILNKHPNTQALVATRTDRTLASPHDPRMKTDRWFPQDIDRIIPPVAPGAACSLSDVLSQAGK